LIAARLGEQRREVRSTAAEGASLFGYLILGKQNKVTRLSGRDPTCPNNQYRPGNKHLPHKRKAGSAGFG